MSNLISMEQWKVRKEEEERQTAKDQLESWLNGGDIARALDALWEELFLLGYVNTKDEFYGLTVPHALALQQEARKDKKVSILIVDKED